MARARTSSIGEGLKTPHTVSLKVLRLTRPALAQQFPLSRTDSVADAPFPKSASLAYPFESSAVSNDFILTPLLNFPESFQSAYVGETFSCTLSANNELPAGNETGTGQQRTTISGVRIAAEIITPSNPSGRALELQTPAPDVDAGMAMLVSSSSSNTSSSSTLRAGASLQRILSLNLQEEGEHTLAVLVTYTETTMAVGGSGQSGRAAAAAAAGSGRVRTFRKLYQFVAANLVSVRTKAGNLEDGRYALEAQLENLGERSIVLDAVKMNSKTPFIAHSLNWDMDGLRDGSRAPVLNPRDIVQIAFLIEQDPTQTTDSQDSATAGDKRSILGQLNISWRGNMGDRGSISTGWLTSKPR